VSKTSAAKARAIEEARKVLAVRIGIQFMPSNEEVAVIDVTGSWLMMQGIGIRDQGPWTREQGTGSREQGTGNRG
jgi:hypothetical protein